MSIQTKAPAAGIARVLPDAGAAWIGGLLALAVVVGGLAPQNPIPSFVPGQDKFEHLIAFALLALLLSAGRRVTLWLGAFLVAAPFALEAAQMVLTATRSPALDDALASLVGVGLGLAAPRASQWLQGSFRIANEAPA